MTQMKRKRGWQLETGLALAVLLACLAMTSQTMAAVTDAPHNYTQGVSCGDCHSYSLWWQWSPTTKGDPDFYDMGQSAYNGKADAICNQCHNDPAQTIATYKKAHSSANLGTDHGTWATSCVDCHNPHSHDQLEYAGTDAAGLYLVTGAITSVSTDATSTTIGYSVDIADVNAGWQSEATWADLRLVVDTAATYNVYIVGAVNITQTFNPDIGTGEFTIDAVLPQDEIDLVNSAADFGLIYGRLIRSRIEIMAADGINTESRTVRFFDPNLTLGATPGAIGGFVETTNDPRQGLCQVCHTTTLHWSNDVATSDETHQLGGAPDYLTCTACHFPVEAFAKPNIVMPDHSIFLLKRDPAADGNCESCHDRSGSASVQNDIHSTCSNCHELVNYDLIAGGNGWGDASLYGPKNLGGSATCDVCHVDRAANYKNHVNANDHSGQVASTANGTCDTCHSEVGEEVINATHNVTATADTPCDKCHVEALTDGRLNGLVVVNSPSVCTDCHGTVETPHNGAYHVNAGLVSLDVTCAACHADPATTFTDIADPKVHNGCTTCHNDPTTYDFSLIGSAANRGKNDAGFGNPNTCVTCHGDMNAKHGGSYHDTKGYVTLDQASDCADCHIDPVVTFIDGANTKVHNSCSSCHTDPNNGDMTLLGSALDHGAQDANFGNPNTCETCHGDFSNHLHHTVEFNVVYAIDGLDNDPLTLEDNDTSQPAPDTDGCAGCHGTLATFNNILAVHQSDCTICHTSTRDTGINPPYTSVANVIVTAAMASCDTCHDDKTPDAPHGLVDHSQQVPAGFVPVQSDSFCVSCHNAADVASGIHTTGCSTCHTNTPPTLNATVLGRVSDAQTAGAACSECHSTYTDFASGHQNEDHVNVTANNSATCITCHSEAGIIVDIHKNNCEVCHTDTTLPDTDGTLIGSAAGHTIGQASGCVDCHSGYNTDFATGHQNEDHLNVTANNSATCITCHSEASIIVDIHKNNCENCHADTTSPGTNGTLVGSAVGHTIGQASGCVDCHAAIGTDFMNHTIPGGYPGTLGWHEPANLSLYNYDANGNPDGQTGDCYNCHHDQNGTDIATQVHVTNQCSGCHTAVTGVLKQHATATVAPAAGDCAVCHDDRVAPHGSIDHLAQGKVVESADCTACHDSQANRDYVNEIHARAGYGCGSCHENVGGGGALHDYSLSGGVIMPNDYVNYEAVNNGAGGSCQDCHVQGGQVSEIISVVKASYNEGDSGNVIVHAKNVDSSQVTVSCDGGGAQSMIDNAGTWEYTFNATACSTVTLTSAGGGSATAAVVDRTENGGLDFDQLDDFSGLTTGQAAGFGSANWSEAAGTDGTSQWMVWSGATDSANGPSGGNPGEYVVLESSPLTDPGGGGSTPTLNSYHTDTGSGTYGGMTVSHNSNLCPDMASGQVGILAQVSSFPGAWTCNGVRLDFGSNPTNNVQATWVFTTPYAADTPVEGGTLTFHFRERDRSPQTVTFELGYASGGSFTSFGSVSQAFSDRADLVVSLDMSGISGTAPAGSVLALRVLDADNSSTDRMNLGTADDGLGTIRLTVTETIDSGPGDFDPVNGSDSFTAGSSQYLESSVIDASQYALFFSFDYNMNVLGNTDASLHVDAWNGSSWDADVASPVTSPTGDTWSSSGSIDLTAYSNADFKVRLRYVVGSNGELHDNDVAVDNLHFTAAAYSTLDTVTITSAAWNETTAELTVDAANSDASQLYLDYGADNAVLMTVNPFTYSVAPEYVGWVRVYSDGAAPDFNGGEANSSVSGAPAGGTEYHSPYSHTITAASNCASTCHTDADILGGIHNVVNDPTDCYLCHQSSRQEVIDAIYNGADGVGQNCANCHSAINGSYSSHAADTHNLLTAPADTAIQSNDCDDCHSGNVQTVVHNVSKSCDNCHTNLTNDATLISLAASNHTIGSTSTCLTCHGSSYFPNHSYDPSHTVAIDGDMSETTTCDGCHTGQSENWSNIKARHNNANGAASVCLVCHDSTRTEANTPGTIDPVLGLTDNSVQGVIVEATGIVSCLDCHYDKRFSHGNIDHTTYNGGAVTADTTCTSCHDQGSVGGNTHYIETIHGATAGNCSPCHANANGGGVLVDYSSTGGTIGEFVNYESVAPSGGTCTACHESYNTSFMNGHKNEDHGLVTGNNSSQCTSCHADIANIISGIHNDSCTLCHTDTANDGSLTGSALNHTIGQASGCVDCHTAQTSNFETGHSQSTPHNGLTSTASCTTSCHTGAIMSSSRIHGNLACTDCHSNMVSNGSLTGSASAHTVGTTSACADCHSAVSHNTDTDHNNRQIAWPGAATPCSNCHTSNNDTIGQAGNGSLTSQADVDALHDKNWDGTVMANQCELCHWYQAGWANPEGLPTVASIEGLITSGKGGTTIDCLDCHDYNLVDHPGHTDAFTRTPTCTTACHPSPDGITQMHVNLTGDCGTCHVSAGGGGTLQGSATGQNLNSSCSDCHGSTDPQVVHHGGASATNGDCINCHTPEVGQTYTQRSDISMPTNLSCNWCHLYWPNNGYTTDANNKVIIYALSFDPNTNPNQAAQVSLPTVSHAVSENTNTPISDYASCFNCHGATASTKANGKQVVPFHGLGVAYQGDNGNDSQGTAEPTDIINMYAGPDDPGGGAGIDHTTARHPGFDALNWLQPWVSPNGGDSTTSGKTWYNGSSGTTKKIHDLDRAAHERPDATYQNTFDIPWDSFGSGTVGAPQNINTDTGNINGVQSIPTTVPVVPISLP